MPLADFLRANIHLGRGRSAMDHDVICLGSHWWSLSVSSV
jgi:hypothetical protein